MSEILYPDMSHEEIDHMMERLDSKKSDRDLDRRCAEILGWTELSFSSPADFRDVRYLHGVMPQSLSRFRNSVPCFSTSLDACRELLKWAKKEEGESKLFSQMFCYSIGINAEDITYSEVLELLLTTPRQICEAFVECFGGNDDHTAENR